MKFLTVVPTHLYLSFAVLIFGVWVGTQFASAEIFGIKLDSTCLAFIKNNITSNCPTYQQIKLLFPDTSNTRVSGDFGYKDGIYQRLQSKMTNSFAYYDTTGKNQLFIDPPGDMLTRINIIEIKANLKEYKLPFQQGFDNKNHSLIVGVGRYVDKYCNQASIDSANWIFLTGDTLQYMGSNCDPSFTSYNSTKRTYLSMVTHDISTSYKFKLEKWIKGIKENCVTKTCFYTANQTRQP